MSIVPLPQFEADMKAAEEDRQTYTRLKTPTTIVVRFGVMRLIGEFPYKGDAKPGCGSKIVVRTHRGTELGEMLTSTCPNSGCGKSVSRKEMLEYVERSGGRDYPFFEDGRALRVASVTDLNEQARLDGLKKELLKDARRRAKESELKMEFVEAEPILGGERLTLYFTAEERIDFRQFARELAAEHGTRIELRQIGARDEARLTADYERCGQHCCCKQFLKVLKPVSMRSAKVQKATLDPLKISGRCGRLMCCLRYEDETYETLRKRLPNRRSRVGTAEGPGIVVDTQILTQLALVELDSDRRRIAVPIEDLLDPDAPPPKPAEAPMTPTTPTAPKAPAARPAKQPEQAGEPSERSRGRGRRKRGGAPGTAGSGTGTPPAGGAKAPETEGGKKDDASGGAGGDGGRRSRSRRGRDNRRGRRRKRGGGSGSGGGNSDG